jgi:hypothetical protein
MRFKTNIERKNWLKYKKPTKSVKHENGGPFNETYNLQRAIELGYTPDKTGHMPSVDEETGMWLKSSDHETAWKEYLYGSLNKELGSNYNVRVNPEGYFGERQLQYVPKTYGGKVPNPHGIILLKEHLFIEILLKYLLINSHTEDTIHQIYLKNLSQ